MNTFTAAENEGNMAAGLPLCATAAPASAAEEISSIAAPPSTAASASPPFASALPTASACPPLANLASPTAAAMAAFSSKGASPMPVELSSKPLSIGSSK